MKIFYLFFICALAISCNSTKEEQHEIVETISTPTFDTITSSLVIDSLKLSNAIDSIWNCEKVQAKQLEVKSLSNNQRQLTLIQSEKEDEITIKLAEDNGINYVTYFIFYITPSNNYSIKYMDVVEGDLVDFREWCEEDFHTEVENTIIGEWSMNKIGLGQCNVCPELKFKSNSNLTIIDVHGIEEQYTWYIEDYQKMRINQLADNENSILNSGLYDYYLSFGKTYMELELMHAESKKSFTLRK